MKKINFKDFLPHIIAIAVFLLISIIYCLPLFQGMVVNQHDMIGTKGMTQQSIEFFEKYGRYPLWTNSMFSGMPTYQILFAAKYNIGIGWMHNIFTGFLPSVAGLFFLSCIGFYILSISLKLKPWVGIFGSLAYAFASYNAIIAVVGHVTKFATMGYAPAVLAAFIVLMDRKYILGFAMMIIFSTLFFTQNHVQMVYYFMLVMVCLGVAFLIKTIQSKDYKHFIKATSLALIAVAIGAASFAVILLPTNEYAKETMRGGRSELTLDKTAAKENKSAGGLDKDYAFGWSYGKAESFTFVLPNFNGSDGDPAIFGENSKVIEALQNLKFSNGQALPEQAVNAFYGGMSPYWGTQPNTSGPVYFGAIVCMLFLAGLVFAPKKHLYWLIPATIIGLILGWGNNLASINYFLFDHLPGLNKFRSPSSAMVIPQLTFPIVAALALQQIFYGNLEKSVLIKKLKVAGLAVAALLIVMTGLYFSLPFTTGTDAQGNNHDKRVKEGITQQVAQMMAQGKEPSAEMTAEGSGMANSLNRALVQDRKSIFGSDLVRMYLYIILGAGLIFLGFKYKWNPILVVSIIALISFIDLVSVDNRYLNKSKYTTPDEYVQGLSPNTADQFIKKDTSYFRVLDQSSGGDPFQDSRASYFHNSIGGYSPAKLALYEDLKTYQLQKGNREVYNMLNTRYIIASDPSSGRVMAQPNTDANGPVWFVKAIKYVNNANEEMLALDSLHSMDTVVIDKREQPKVTGAPQFDSAASIKLIKNLNDEITYQTKASSAQFAVFSEIYYPLGWKAYIDGKESPIIKVDYAFRGMNIPAGDHTIRFEFKPKTYDTANMIALVAGVITIVALLLCAFLLFKQNNKRPLAQ